MADIGGHRLAVNGTRPFRDFSEPGLTARIASIRRTSEQCWLLAPISVLVLELGQKPDDGIDILCRTGAAMS